MITALTEPRPDARIGDIDVPLAPSVDVEHAAPPSPISVECVDAVLLANLQPHWANLIARAAAPNVFMDPSVVRAAAESDAGLASRTLLAWKRIEGRRQLVGVWALAIGRPQASVLPMRVLNAPPYAHSYLATPVIDASCLEEVLDAMLDRLAADRDAPKIVALDAMEIEAPTMTALTRVLERRGSSYRVFEQFQRPKLVSSLDGAAYLAKAISSSSRKKLRQHRRRLSEKGALRSAIALEPQAVAAALEQFLNLEASGWKGKQGSALLSNDKDAAFVRTAMRGLAEKGCASIHALYLDDRPVSMQLVVRAGTAAFTWKTSYDEEFRDFSPGMLLFEDYTAAFLADGSIAFVDSCAHDESSFMSAWSDRQRVADLWFDARRGGSLTFLALAFLQEKYRAFRATLKSAYLSARR